MTLALESSYGYPVPILQSALTTLCTPALGPSLLVPLPQAQGEKRVLGSHGPAEAVS